MTIDLSQTITPKSDQLNADDLITSSITIKITNVSKSETPDQPVSIHFEGDNGKPYKPCKSMRRVLVQVWGRDGQSYVGKSLTLYRDNGVKFGGVDVGGIRISHMSDIAKPITLALTASKTQRKPFTVQPLKEEKQAKTQPAPVAEEEKDVSLSLPLAFMTPNGDFSDIQTCEKYDDWFDKFETSIAALHGQDVGRAIEANLLTARIVFKNIDGMKKDKLERIMKAGIA